MKIESTIEPFDSVLTFVVSFRFLTFIVVSVVPVVCDKDETMRTHARTQHTFIVLSAFDLLRRIFWEFER
jgi:hypothetical protein